MAHEVDYDGIRVTWSDEEYARLIEVKARRDRHAKCPPKKLRQLAWLLDVGPYFDRETRAPQDTWYDWRRFSNGTGIVV